MKLFRPIGMVTCDCKVLFAFLQPSILKQFSISLVG